MKKLLLFCLVFLVSFFAFSGMPLANAKDLALSSEAAVLMDTQSGAILFGKNESSKMYPASLTKIATAIYAIENGNLDDLVTVSDEILNVEGTRVYLMPGEQVPLKKLVQGMLVNSGNDAAVAIAIHLDGSMKEFSQHLNGYLEEEIGVTQTHFENPHGLFHENHYTTAKDLGMILNYAMKNPDFREIFGTKKLAWHGEAWDTTLLSHHRMLKGEIPYDGVTGGKTGYVDQSKQTLATTADNGKIKLTAILLKSEYKRGIYEDTKKLFDYGFDHFRSSKLTKKEKFSKEKKRFSLKEDTYITEPASVSKKILGSDGTLSIQDEEGRVIQTVKLKPVAEKKNTVAKNTSEPEQNGIAPVNSMIGGSLFLLATGVFLLNRKQKKKRRYRSR